jgi:hypothetical protein
MTETAFPASQTPALAWYNEPARWSAEPGRLHLRADPHTDFWRITHYGFTRDNGHFGYLQQAGDFLATVRFRGDYRFLYDQAGLMIRLDAENWIKTGIEYVHGVQQLSAVVTRGYSDWSVVPLADPPAYLWLKLLRRGDYVEISHSTDGVQYTLLRLAYFPPAVPAQIGLMAAAPDGEGFEAVFEDFAVAPLQP